MAITLNAVSLFNSSVTPTAPLIEGVAATTLSASSFDTATSVTGRYGMRVTFPSALDLSASDYISFFLNSTIYSPASFTDTVANGGFRIIFIDGSGNYSGFNIYGSNIPDYNASNGGFQDGFFVAYVTTDNTWVISKARTPDIVSGTVNWGNITACEVTVKNNSADRKQISLSRVTRRSNILITGTETLLSIRNAASAAATAILYTRLIQRTPFYQQSSSASIFSSALGLTVGDGSTATNWTDSNFSLGFENTYDKSPTYRSTGPWIQLDNSNTRLLSINQSAADVLSLTDGSIASAAWWQWQLSGSGTATITRVSFWRFNSFSAAHGNYIDCSWNQGEQAVACTAATIITRGAVRDGVGHGIQITSGAASYTGLQIAFSNNSTYDIELGSGGAGTYGLSAISVIGAYTLKIRNNSATNAITVEIPAGITYSTSTAGGSIIISSPTVERGIAFTGLQTGTSIQVFTSGTQTKLFGDNSTAGSTFAFDDATGGSITVDYTIQKAGFFPQRVVGQVLTGSVGGQLDVAITQVPDRAYVASSGLTYGTNAVVTVGTNPATNPSTKTFTLSVASTVQNWYSFWIEQWIDKGNATGEALANVAFPLSQNGPNSFSLGDGWTWGTGSIALLSRDGMRYLNTSGNVTAAWAAILSAGVPASEQVRFEQTNGGTVVSAANTGNIDQLVQIVSDPNGDGNYTDGYDYRGFMVLKVQGDGYDQAESNAVSLYGNLEDQLFVVGLTPAANGIAAATITGVTITDHGASPVTWNSKQFSITITDTTDSNDGIEILQYVRGLNDFDYHDLVQKNGASFKTVNGTTYGGAGAAVKGVRVVKADGTTAHASFDLFTADDGTTYAPAFVLYQSVTITNLIANSRVQIYDTTNSVELFNGVVTGTTKTWTDTVAAAGNRAIRIRISNCITTTAYDFVDANVGTCGTTIATAGVSYLASQSLDTTYNTNALDGSGVTGITIAPSPARVSISIAGGSVTWPQIYAYQVYWLYTAVGIADQAAFIEAPDTANYLLNNFDIKNTHANPLTITGGYGRDASTGLVKDCIDTAGSTGNIFPMPDHAIPYSSGSGLTAGQAAQLSTIESSTALSRVVDGAITKAGHEKIILAALAGKRSGLGTATETYMAQDGTTPRITLTPDAAGNGAPTLNGAA